MKKSSKTILIALVFLFLFTSCTTSLTVSYLVPAEINMGKYRHVAVASAVRDQAMPEAPFFLRTSDGYASREYGNVFPSWDAYSLSKSVARDATGQMVNMLKRSGFFDVTGPDITDRIIDASIIGYNRREAFERYGIDAVIIPKVEAMGVNEWIWTKVTEKEIKNEDGTVRKESVLTYNYDRQVALRFSYTIIDTQSEKVIAKKSFTRNASSTEPIASKTRFIPDDPYSDFSYLLSNIMREAERQMVPSTYSFSVALMDDGKDNAKAATALEMIGDGYYAEAEKLFVGAWQDTGNWTHAYNAAILMASRGAFESATALLDDAGKYGYNRDIAYLRSLISEAGKSHQSTLDQLEKGNPDAFEGPSIYDQVRQ